MMPKVMPMGPKGPILGNPWKVTLQGRPDVDFLIDVCSEMVGQELISRIVRIPRGSPESADPPDPADQVSSTAARNHPSTRAGGQDDVSLNKLPQIILIIIFLMLMF